MLALGALIVLLAAWSAPPRDPDERIGAGVSAALARERAAVIDALRYDLAFAIPVASHEPVTGRAAVTLTLRSPHRLVLDFARPRDRVRALRVNGRAMTVEMVDGHIVIPVEATRAGTNEVAIEFVAGDEALNRNPEFLYTLFVPARARFAFPCFDQPDLKARYTLRLSVPEGWQAVANGTETARRTSEPGVETIEFAETPPLSTYLFAFVAGKFSVDAVTRTGRTFRLFHRETNTDTVARNRDAIVDLHASALAWLEAYTEIPYPWGKFDLVLIPSFQFGGMEHPAAILYSASRLMLEASASQNDQLERASLIAHETAHMWFGDLVTMRWFDDVWMKEVFANFMAAKIVNPAFPGVNHELRFLLAHYPAAYAVDRTEGANPIRQALGNLDEAGQLYGPVIYQKAPIVMRQLEMMLGESAFRDGTREYLKTHAFGNATWSDLIQQLDPRTTGDLAGWSRAWVEERGRPTVTISRRGPGGVVEGVDLVFDDPRGRDMVWPQQLRVVFGTRDATREVPVSVTDRRVFVRAPAGNERPLYVLASGAGLGYGLFLLDDDSRDYLLQHIEDIRDVLTRGAAWIALWDNVLEARVAGSVFVQTAMRALRVENDEQLVQQLLDYATQAFWGQLSAVERDNAGPALEAVLRAGVARATTARQKAAWFRAYRDIALSDEGLAWLERVWRRDEPVPGLVLAEPDEIVLAMELAVRAVPRWNEILDTQLARIENLDRRARFEFVGPALSADAVVREQAFARLGLPENRRHEPWVLESLRYLNHPLREAHARRFVRPALEWLPEIQRTGDIFFPTRWLESTLRGHSSPEAAGVVRTFLARKPQLPERLRWAILVAADDLFRASAR